MRITLEIAALMLLCRGARLLISGRRNVDAGVATAGESGNEPNHQVLACPQEGQRVYADPRPTTGCYPQTREGRLDEALRGDAGLCLKNESRAASAALLPRKKFFAFQSPVPGTFQMVSTAILVAGKEGKALMPLSNHLTLFGKVEPEGQKITLVRISFVQASCPLGDVGSFQDAVSGMRVGVISAATQKKRADARESALLGPGWGSDLEVVTDAACRKTNTSAFATMMLLLRGETHEAHLPKRKYGAKVDHT